MKKNFSVNIGKRLFNIDEDAYESLNSYLGRLRSYFLADESHEEILADIEMRIAELLEQKVTQRGQGIVVYEFVQEVINEMGEPGQLSGNGEEPVQSSAAKPTGKLFRDPVNHKVGGVASGISAFFVINPLWIRLGFVLSTLLYGSGPVIYLILWIILPEAQTTSEKLEMQRQIINVGTLRQELASAGDGIKKGSSSVLGLIGEFLRNAFEIAARLIGWFFQLFGRLAGLLLLFFVLIAFIALIPAFLVREDMEFGSYNFDSVTMYQVFQWAVPATSDQWLFYLAFVLIVVSLSGLLIYSGLRLLLKWPPLRWQVVIAFVVILFAGIFTSGAAIFRYSRSTDYAASQRENSHFPIKGNSFHILSGMWDVQKFKNPLNEIDQSKFESGVLGEINLSFRPAPGDSLVVSLIRDASSMNKSMADDFASAIDYSFHVNDTSLLINPYFVVPFKDGMQYQELSIIVGIPVNKEVFIDKEICWKARYSDFYNCDNDGGVYLMSSYGLIKKTIGESAADTTAYAN